MLEFDSTLGYPGEGPLTFSFSKALSEFCSLFVRAAASACIFTCSARPCRWNSNTGSSLSVLRLSGGFPSCPPSGRLFLSSASSLL